MLILRPDPEAVLKDREAQQQSVEQREYCHRYRTEIRPLFWQTPLVSVDLGIFTLHEGRLQVLLVERHEHPWKGMWALPGGFVHPEDAGLDAAALRVLGLKTGLGKEASAVWRPEAGERQPDRPYLKQWKAVGSSDRDARFWSVTALYYALIRHVEPSDRRARWFPVDALTDLPEAMNPALGLPPVTGANGWPLEPAPDNRRDPRHELAFDHAGLLKSLVGFLREEVAYGIMPAYMLPMRFNARRKEIYPEDADFFTLADVLQAYEILMNKELKVTSIRRRFGVYGESLNTREPESSGRTVARDRRMLLAQVPEEELAGFKRPVTGKPPAYYRLADPEGLKDFRHPSPLTGMKQERED